MKETGKLNFKVGVGYAPHMFGSGPNSWYTHRLGIYQDYSRPTNEANYPFDHIPFNLNNDLLKHRDSRPYKRRIINDVKIMCCMGIRLVRIHVFPTTYENLPFLEWLASVCKDHVIKLMVDLVKERPEHWNQIDPEMCGIYARKLRGKVAIWQLMNETNDSSGRVPELLISLFKEAATKIKKADSDALICLNNARFDSEYTEHFINAGAPIDVLGVDYYPPSVRSISTTENGDKDLSNECEKLRIFHEKHPDIKIVIDEFGIHPWEKVQYSTSRLELHGSLFDKYCRIVLREAGDVLFAFIPFWFQDLLVFRTRCYHQLVNLDRTLTPLGESYVKIIRDYTPNPISLENMPEIRRKSLSFDEKLQPVDKVEYQPSIKEVGNYLEKLRSPLIVVGDDLSPNFYECGMFMAKTLSFFLQKQPEVRTASEVQSGKGKGSPSIFLGNSHTNLILQNTDIERLHKPRQAKASLVNLDGRTILVLDGSDDDGVIAVTLDLVRRYWRTKNSLSPEFNFA